jgi:peptidoglycan hydrolase CwlO-like protein
LALSDEEEKGMQAELKQLEEKIHMLISRVRELENERDRLQAEIRKLDSIRETAAIRITGLLDKLEEPE